MSVVQLSIGGVPEHFNLPWHLARESGALAAAGIDLRWSDFPGGTGAMVEALHGGTIDAAVLLTEGAVADVLRGSPLRIVSHYVASPLIWGVHVHARSAWRKPMEMQTARIAISRPTSGSHLMALVEARQQGWDARSLTFVEVRDLNGARAALESGEADFFLWEKYTTKPLVDSGEWRRVGEVPTPWPSFVVAATQAWLAGQGGVLERALTVVRAELARALQSPDVFAADVAKRYGQQPADAAAWLASTRWTGAQEVDGKGLSDAAAALYAVGAVPRLDAPESFVWASAPSTVPTVASIAIAV
jgi:sulfonate transport system substrate-binding protein